MSEHEGKQKTAAEESGASASREGGAARAAAEGDARERGTVVVEIPAPQGLLGLAPVISALLLAAAWGVVGIGYICVPGSVAGALLALACAAMNLGGGIAQPALCLGIALACAGLCLPLWYACQVGRRQLLHITRRREGRAPSRTLGEHERCFLIASGLVLLAGCCIAGIAALAGGGEQLALPGFLQALFSQEVPQTIAPGLGAPQPLASGPSTPQIGAPSPVPAARPL